MLQSLCTHSIWNPVIRKSTATVLAVGFCTAHTMLASAQASVTSSVVTTGSKPYVAVANGASTSPYLIYGVQTRIDELLGSTYTPGTTWPAPANPPASDSADYYFLQAKNVGFKTVVVPVRWKYVDFTTTPGGAAYNFEYVHKIINSANTYGLKVQLLWYGTDVCGYSCAPAYIGNSPSTYPNYAGNTNFLDLSNPNLVTAEKNALVAMMNDVASYDTTHSVVMLQIENEPDGCGPVESSLHWGDMTNMASLMYAGGQYNAVTNLINNLAVAVKGSAWQGVTRVNIGSAYRSIDVVRDRAGRTSGVDIFGVDMYTSTLSNVHNTLAQMAPPALFAQLSPIPSIDSLTSTTSGARSNYTANVTHQPEGGGQYGNYISLALSNFADGGGVLTYELRTFQSWQSGGVWQPVYDLGIFRRTTNSTSATRGTWTPRTGSPNTVPYKLDGTSPGVENSTAAITTFNTTIYKADQKIALATPSTCAAFNLDGSLGWTGHSQTVNVAGIPVKFQTWSNTQAFAMKDTNGDLILLNFTDGNNFILDPSFHHATTASVGYYDSANVWHEQYSKSFSGDTLLCWAGDCIRIPRLP